MHLLLMSLSSVKVTPAVLNSRNLPILGDFDHEIHEMKGVISELEKESGYSFQEKYNRLDSITDIVLKQEINCIDLNPDSSLLAIGISKNVVIWSIADKLLQSTLTGHLHEIRTISFNSTGEKLLTSSSDKTCRIWDMQSRKQETVFEGHEDAVITAAFNHDSSLVASAGADKKIIFWSVSSKMKIGEIKSETALVLSICFVGKEKTIASISRDRSVRLWSVQEKKEIYKFPVQVNTLYCLAASPNGKYLTAGTYITIKIWNIQEKGEGDALSGNEHFVSSMKFTADSNFLVSACMNTNKIRVWNVNEKREEFTLDCPSDIYMITIGSDCKVIVAYLLNYDIYIWNLKESTAERTLNIHKMLVKTIAFSPSQSLIATGGTGGLVNLWDFETNTLYKTFKEHITMVSKVRFSQDGKILASGDFDGHVIIANVATGIIEKKFL